MAKFHGNGGSITWGGVGFESKLTILSWTAEITADVAESTDMGDAWKSYLAGHKDWTATVVAVADEAQSQLAIGITASLKLEMVDAGDNLEGDAICTGISFTTESTAVGGVTHTFQGNDAAGLAYSAS